MLEDLPTFKFTVLILVGSFSTEEETRNFPPEVAPLLEDELDFGLLGLVDRAGVVGDFCSLMSGNFCGVLGGGLSTCDKPDSDFCDKKLGLITCALTRNFADLFVIL